MKFLFSPLLLLFFTSGMAFASSVNELPLPLHWKTGEKIYFAPRPNILVNLLVHKTSTSNWAYLQIESTYPVSFRDQVEQLRAKYPDTEIEWIPAKGEGDPTVYVDALGLEGKSRWVLRQAGTTTGNTFTLSKAQTEAFLRAKENGIRIEGSVQADYPKMTTLEVLTLPPETCTELVPEESDLQSVMLRFAAISARIDRKKSIFPETQSDLKLSLLRDCVDLSLPGPIGSSDELLRWKVSPKLPRVAPRGETRRMSSASATGHYVTGTIDIQTAGIN